MTIGTSKTWTRKRVEIAQNIAREELAALETPELKLGHILSKINGLSSNEDIDGQILRYVYCIHLLLHHEKHGSVPKPQINSTVEMVKAMLLTHRIKAGASYVATLIGHLYTVLGQIARREGNHWASIWLQHLYEYYVWEAEPETKNMRLLGDARRAMRLGLSRIALENLNALSEKDLSEEQGALCNLEIVRALRFMGRNEEALVRCSEMLAVGSLPQPIQVELAWEKRCNEISLGTANLFGLLELVQPGGSHILPGYVLEHFVWAHAVQQTEFREGLPKLKSIRKRKGMDFTVEPVLTDICEVLEQGYDTEIPLHIRVAKLQKITEWVPQLITIDLELLMWAALARLLLRFRSVALGKIALEEYRTLSLKVSDGATVDILKIMGDLIDAHQPQRLELTTLVPLKKVS